MPNHPPEVSDRGLGRPLRNDVGLRLDQTLQDSEEKKGLRARMEMLKLETEIYVTPRCLLYFLLPPEFRRTSGFLVLPDFLFFATETRPKRMYRKRKYELTSTYEALM